MSSDCPECGRDVLRGGHAPTCSRFDKTASAECNGKCWEDEAPAMGFPARGLFHSSPDCPLHGDAAPRPDPNAFMPERKARIISQPDPQPQEWSAGRLLIDSEAVGLTVAEYGAGLLRGYSDAVNDLTQRVADAERERDALHDELLAANRLLDQAERDYQDSQAALAAAQEKAALADRARDFAVVQAWHKDWVADYDALQSAEKETT